MGSPLGPILANIFMCNLEEKFLSLCNNNIKPNFYSRYVDDTFATFNNLDCANQFLCYINGIHPNIKFTIETENNNRLSFLDVSVEKCHNKIVTSVFRKSTFTGLGTNFYSHTPLKYKMCAASTLVHRAYELSSDWGAFHSEISFLINFFSNNCYPKSLIYKKINNYLNLKFRPKIDIPTVPKKIIHLPMPYLGNFQQGFERTLIKLFRKLVPFIELRLSPKNPLSIGTFFNCKDKLPSYMQAGVVYEFSCPKCKLGNTYIGCTTRRLHVRIDEHKGVSPRTGKTTISSLKLRDNSNIGKHTDNCEHLITYKDFKILSKHKDKQSLLISESIHIKLKHPSLNSDLSSIPLQLI